MKQLLMIVAFAILLLIIGVNVFYGGGVGWYDGNARDRSAAKSGALDVRKMLTRPEVNTAKEVVDTESPPATQWSRNDFEYAFNDWYSGNSPENCASWSSEEEMMRCVNHKIRAKASFRAIWDDLYPMVIR